MSAVVLSIGQCSFDNGSLSRLISSLGGTTKTIALHTQVAEAIVSCQPKLILVNRVNDSDGSSGIELIREIRSNPQFEAIPIMLISNYADAQKQALAAGAVPGFGKSQINSTEVSALLKKYLACSGIEKESSDLN